MARPCLLASLLFFASISFCKEAYTENLDLFQLPKGHYLHRFNFSFVLDNNATTSHRIDLMPLQMVKFAQGTPEVREIQVDLVQGRWQENVMKAVTSYSNR